MDQLKKKKLSFPSAFTVLFIVLIIAVGLTYIIPAGSYSKLAYDGDAKEFIVTTPAGEEEVMPATQETLDKLGVKTELKSFTDESIWKPISIPGTYEEVEQSGQNIWDFLAAPISGTTDSIDIILFVFIIGGLIGILNFSGAFTAGIAALSRATKGKEYLLIVVLTFLIALGGTTFGMAEETIALYPVLIPVFIAAKYDVLVCISSIYMGSAVGTMFSTVNPFSVVIASNAAGIDFNNGMAFRLAGLILGVIITVVYIIRYGKKVQLDPSKSITRDDNERIAKKFTKPGEAPAMNARYIISLVLFLATFVVMVHGVKNLGWWFGEMTELFLVSAVIIGLVLGIGNPEFGEKDFVREFVSGAGELIGVALVIGLARAVNFILDNGNVSDSILHSLSSSVEGMNPSLFIVMILLIFILLGFFINSTSGLAVLSIPIVAPLADSVGLPRDVIISAYIFGVGIMTFFTPTGLILATLDLVEVTYNKYLKFAMPLIGMLTILSIIIVLIQANVAL